MSEALDYLLKVRKEVMASYFHFLKESGKNLDSKTRSLLSVINKIDGQTEAGLRQYLVRALREGNQANEILDAMLVCMPILGLSKIIWATNIILKMDIPEFDPESIGKKQEWYRVVNVNELSEGGTRFDYANHSCFVYKKGSDYKVYNGRCPHQATNIPLLALGGTTLTCPKHKWKFNIENGKCIEKGNRPLNDLNFKIEEGYLFVYS